MKTIRVTLNGKGAANPQVRAGINRIRDEGQPLEVPASSAAGGVSADQRGLRLGAWGLGLADGRPATPAGLRRDKSVITSLPGKKFKRPPPMGSRRQ